MDTNEAITHLRGVLRRSSLAPYDARALRSVLAELDALREGAQELNEIAGDLAEVSDRMIDALKRATTERK